MSVERYREQVRKLAEQEDGTPFFNSSAEHARIIMEEGFAKADVEILILSHALDTRVYGGEDLAEDASYFLKKTGSRLRLLVEKKAAAEAIEGHPLIARITKERNAGHVEVRTVPEEATKEYAYNFSVIDGKHYRFEPDRSKIAAVAAFGEKKTSRHLKEIFEIIWEASEVKDIKADLN